MFDHSNSQLTFAGTNLLKGSMSVVESRKFYDQEDKFLEWRFRPLNDPDNLLARVKNKEMSLYADLATNLPTILMNLGVEILKKNSIHTLERNFWMRPVRCISITIE